MKELAIFRETAKDPYAYAEKWKKEKGGKVAGFFCSYTPEELIHASGALPFRIFGTRENITRADTHLQAYCCSLARGGLEDAMAGRLQFLDGTVFPHTCDTIQRLSDIWRLNAGFPFHIDIILPVKLNTDSAREYMTDIIKKARRELAEALGTDISDRDIAEANALYNKIRKALGDIYRLRSEKPGIISGSDVYAVIKTSMVMDRAELITHLELLVGALKKSSPGDNKNARPVVLAGGICNHPDIYDIIEESGAVVVWDELCTGTRYFEGKISEAGDPVESLAARYYSRVVCPAKHMDNTSRGENLLNIVKEHNAAGVIFLLLKFCDPHSFDYPYMKDCLDKENIPSMLLEIEEQLPSEGQLKTRFETFADML